MSFLGNFHIYLLLERYYRPTLTAAGCAWLLASTSLLTSNLVTSQLESNPRILCPSCDSRVQALNTSFYSLLLAWWLFTILGLGGLVNRIRRMQRGSASVGFSLMLGGLILLPILLLGTLLFLPGLLISLMMARRIDRRLSAPLSLLLATSIATVAVTAIEYVEENPTHITVGLYIGAFAFGASWIWLGNALRNPFLGQDEVSH